MFKKLMMPVLALTLIGSVSCTSGASNRYSVDDSIVQVWQSAAGGQEADLLAFGVVVSDGTEVLTVLDYESYTPGPLEVISKKYGIFQTSVQAIDSRTSATLLKLDKGTLLAAKTGEAPVLQTEQSIKVKGWQGDGDPLRTINGLASAGSLQTALFFSVNEISENNSGIVIGNGAPILDSNGLVVGLLGTGFSGLVVRFGYPGMLPLAVSIDGALDLLSEDVSTSALANGPLQMPASCYIRQNGGDYWWSPLSDADYNRLITTIDDLLSSVGQPLDKGNLSAFRDYVWGQSNDGKLFTTVFANTVDLKSAQGEKVASARWVSFQWDRSDNQPARIIYGNTPYTVSGVFATDTNAVSALVNYFPQYLRDSLLES